MVEYSTCSTWPEFVIFLVETRFQVSYGLLEKRRGILMQNEYHIFIIVYILCTWRTKWALYILIRRRLDTICANFVPHGSFIMIYNGNQNNEITSIQSHPIKYRVTQLVRVRFHCVRFITIKRILPCPILWVHIPIAKLSCGVVSLLLWQALRVAFFNCSFWLVLLIKITHKGRYCG